MSQWCAWIVVLLPGCLIPNALLAVQCVSSALPVRYPVCYPVRYPRFVLSRQYEVQAGRSKEIQAYLYCCASVRNGRLRLYIGIPIEAGGNALGNALGKALVTHW